MCKLEDLEWVNPPAEHVSASAGQDPYDPPGGRKPKYQETHWKCRLCGEEMITYMPLDVKGSELERQARQAVAECAPFYQCKPKVKSPEEIEAEKAAAEKAAKIKRVQQMFGVTPKNAK